MQATRHTTASGRSCTACLLPAHHQPVTPRPPLPHSAWHGQSITAPTCHGSRACLQPPRAQAAAAAPADTPLQQQPPLQFQDGEWREAFAAAAQEAGAAGCSSGFVELSFKGKLSQKLPYRLVTVRPVQLKAGTQLQFSYCGERQNVVKNAAPGSTEASERLQELLHTLPFSSASLKTQTQDVSVQLTKSGRAIVHRVLAATPRGPIQLGHDRRKGLPIPPDVPHPFLQRIGMQTAEGRLKADMVDKMAQVNDFLKLLGHTGMLEALQQQQQQQPDGSDRQGLPAAPAAGHSDDGQQGDGAVSGPQQRVIRILDAGCGSSHLTFGTWHYLNNVLGLRAQLVGVDSNAALMAKCNAYSRELGLASGDASFVASSISDYQPQQPPDVVLALHACDTATDEALALAVKQGASVIMAVPCCHKHLHKQLAGAKGLAVPPMQPLMRQGIMRQRMLDLLTDTLRAQLLRICGYRTDVVEFVSTEHTPRNLLIRAVRQQQQQQQQPFASKRLDEQLQAQPSLLHSPSTPGAPETDMQQQLVAEYTALKAFWGGVTPHLEVLLQEELSGVQSLA